MNPHSENPSQPLSWSVAPTRSLLSLAWPIVVSMLSYSVMTLVDTLFVGRLGSHALAGVGLGGINAFILMCFPMGLLGAVKILSSQSVGAGRPEERLAYVGAGIGLGGLLALVAIGIGQLTALFIPAIAATTRTGEAAGTYLSIRVLGALPVLVRIAIEQGRLANGDSHSPMRVALLANLCNVALDYLLIVRLGFGVQGAAWATVSANLLGCAAMVRIQLREGLPLRAASMQHARQVFRIGLPSGLQFALEVGSYAVMVVMLTHLSELDGAANQIAIQVIHFGFLPCVALGEAASVMAGQAVGARRRELVHRVAFSAMLPTAAYTVLCMLLLIFGGHAIVSLFTHDPVLLELTTHLLYVAAAFQIADGANIVARGVLRGTGDVDFAARVGIAVAWVMTPAATWLLGYRLGLGALGGWLGICMEIFVAAGIFWWRLRGDFWHAAADRTLRAVALTSPSA